MPTFEEVVKDPSLLINYTPVDPSSGNSIEEIIKDMDDNLPSIMDKIIEELESGNPNRLEKIRKSKILIYWYRFIGSELEAEVSYHASEIKIENLVEAGEKTYLHFQEIQPKIAEIYQQIEEDLVILSEWLTIYKKYLDLLDSGQVHLPDEFSTQTLYIRYEHLVAQQLFLRQSSAGTRVVLTDASVIQERWNHIKKTVIPLWKQGRITFQYGKAKILGDQSKKSFSIFELSNNQGEKL